jgi:hypothetical protein
LRIARTRTRSMSSPRRTRCVTRCSVTCVLRTPRPARLVFHSSRVSPTCAFT